MTRKFLSLFLGVFLAVVMYRQSLSPAIYLILGASGIALVALLNYWTFRKKIFVPANLVFLILPCLWIISGIAVASLVSSPILVLAVCTFFLVGFLFIQSVTDPLRILSANLEIWFFFSYFGIFLGIFAVDFYFSPGWWIIMILSFCFNYVFFWLALSSVAAAYRQRTLFAVILSFVFTEIMWAMLFWPLIFFPNALIIASLFYLAWSVTRMHFARILTLDKFLVHAVFILFVQIIVLASSRWLPSV